MFVFKGMNGKITMHGRQVGFADKLIQNFPQNVQ